MMKPRSVVLQQTAIVAIGLALATTAMFGIFALLGQFDTSVLLGGIVGAATAGSNFFLMARLANRAADRASSQDPAGAQMLIRLSYVVRMIGILAILLLCAGSGLFHIIALVLPLGFVRPILTFSEYIQKKGDAQP